MFILSNIVYHKVPGLEKLRQEREPAAGRRRSILDKVAILLLEITGHAQLFPEALNCCRISCLLRFIKRDCFTPLPQPLHYSIAPAHKLFIFAGLVVRAKRQTKRLGQK